MDGMAFEGAFVDPPRQSQCMFRALLGAMAELGTVHDLPPQAAAPAPLSPAMAAVALTLCDAETPVFLADAFAGPGAAWLAFHTDAPLLRERGAARLAFLDVFELDGFALGTDAYPDRSATPVVECALAGTPFVLSGPGNASSRALAAKERHGDPAVPALTLAQITEQLALAADRVMVEGLAVQPRQRLLHQPARSLIVSPRGRVFGGETGVRALGER